MRNRLVLLLALSACLLPWQSAYATDKMGEPEPAADGEVVAAPEDTNLVESEVPGENEPGGYDADGNYIWPTKDDVVAYYHAAYGKKCQWVIEGRDAEGLEPEQYELQYANDYDEADTPKQIYDLYIFPCTQGAYNFGSVYISVSEYDGIAPVSFSEPHYDVVYENDDYEGKVKAITIDGFTASDILINSGYDPETQTIGDFSKWRGIGDASSAGVWAFDQGRWVLKTYDIDASYDGEGNPERVIEY